jgi:hypothetical protein
MNDLRINPDADVLALAGKYSLSLANNPITSPSIYNINIERRNRARQTSETNGSSEQVNILKYNGPEALKRNSREGKAPSNQLCSEVKYESDQIEYSNQNPVYHTAYANAQHQYSRKYTQQEDNRNSSPNLNKYTHQTARYSDPYNKYPIQDQNAMRNTRSQSEHRRKKCKLQCPSQ